jgi:hypothetical protein
VRRAALAALLLAAACSRGGRANYRNCLKLRVGMTGAEVLALMGPANETVPYVEGKSLPHLKGRTSFEWSNPASMSAPNIVSMEESSGRAVSIRCGDSVVTAGVVVEPKEVP